MNGDPFVCVWFGNCCVHIRFRILFVWIDWDVAEQGGNFCPARLPAQVVTYGHRCFRQGLPEALGYFLCRRRGQEVSRTAHQINNSEAVYKRPPAYEDSSQPQAQDWYVTPCSLATDILEKPFCDVSRAEWEAV
jgi:hypothetical protein